MTGETRYIRTGRTNGMAYVLIVLSWVFFGLIHSLTASLNIKAWVMARWPPAMPYYRLVYNLVALLTFLPVLIALQNGPDALMLRSSGTVLTLLYWTGSSMLLTGIVVSVLALRGYDLHEFVGWPNLRTTPIGDGLRQGGLLRYIRHPLYLGIVLILAGLFLVDPYWKQLLFSVLALIYLRAGIYFEERKLIRQFGDAYLNYRRKTPMLFPSSSLLKTNENRV